MNNRISLVTTMYVHQLIPYNDVSTTYHMRIRTDHGFLSWKRINMIKYRIYIEEYNTNEQYNKRMGFSVKLLEL